MDTESGRNPLLGILFVIFAMLGFSIMSGVVKAASFANVATEEVMFIQNAAAFVALLPWFIKEGRGVFIPRNKILVIFRALLGISSMYLFFLAVKLTPLVNAVLLQNTAPLFIPVLFLLLFKKRIALKVFASMVIGFIGVVLVLNPGKGFLKPGDIIALLAGFISALVTIVISQLDDKDEPVTSIMFYYLLITILVTGAWSAHTWNIPKTDILLYLILAGIIYACFQVLMILSLKYATPVIVSPFMYLGVIFSGLIDWLIWKQAPDPMTVIGTFVVISGVALSTLRAKR